jgi:hypothetical protein
MTTAFSNTDGRVASSKLECRLDNVERARTEDERKVESTLEMIKQLQDENSHKRKMDESEDGEENSRI